MAAVPCPACARPIARTVRSRWGVNRLHSCLDVQFNEGQSTFRTGFAAKDFAIIRPIVMNPIRLTNSCKGRIKTMRMLVATSDLIRTELFWFMTLRYDTPPPVA